MKKRISSLLLSLILLLGLVPVGAQAAYSGSFSGCSWTYESGLLTLSPAGDGRISCDFNGFETPWWREHFGGAIKTIVMEDGIRQVDGGLFWTCDNVRDIYLPASLESLDNNLFAKYRDAPLTVHFGGSLLQWEALLRVENYHNWAEDVPVQYYSTWNNGQSSAPSGTILRNFTPLQEYYPGLFTDVKATDWFAGNVATAYRYDLMKGIGAGLYDPKGNITVGQTVTIAARLHNTYYDNGYQFVQGTPWYKTYTDYAERYGLVQPGTNYNAVCARATFAAILASAVAPSEYISLNNVTRIPDIHKVDWYADSVYTLYNAGILSGSDQYGTFRPDSGITRAEVSAILARMLDRSQRLTYTLVTPSFDLENPTSRTVFYGPNGQKIYVRYAYDWDFNLYTYQGDFPGMPVISTRWNDMDVTYGSETDPYKAHFYVKGSEQIVVVLVNTLTGAQHVVYMYNLYNAGDYFVGMRFTNVFDSSDSVYLYLENYWENGNYGFTQVIPASFYD